MTDYADFKDLSESDKKDLSNKQATKLDILLIRKSLHDLREKMQSLRAEPLEECALKFQDLENISEIIKQYMEVRIMNGHLRNIIFQRSGEKGFDQMVYDKITFKGFWKKVYAVGIFIIGILTLLNFLHQWNIIKW